MLRWICAGLLVLALLESGRVLAHDEVTLGDYDLEYGWVIEPPVAGVANAFEINLAPSGEEHSHESGEDHKVVDVSGLKVEAVYGGETTPLTLKEADAGGHFTADFTPARPGKYTLKFTGTLGGEAVDAEVQPEEVEPSGGVASDSGDATGVLIVVIAGAAVAIGAGVFVARQNRAKIKS